jgi:isoleucyl-tRNA synthetase
MAKKLKNYPDPMEMFHKYGADSMRVYLMSSPVVTAENLSFKELDVAELTRGMFRMLWNSYSFFVLYADIDKWTPSTTNQKLQTTNLLDKWIVSELQVLTGEYNKHMEAYELNQAVRLFSKFIDNLSNWYIRRSRKRFWKSDDDGDKAEAYQTLHYVLVELSKLMAPFAPFMAEEIFKNLTGKESVHLEDMPAMDGIMVDEKLNQEMQKTRNIITEALQLRAKFKFKVRQPLAELYINASDNRSVAWYAEDAWKFMEDIIKEELNVKSIILIHTIKTKEELKENSNFVWTEDGNVGLDINVTEELKLEGQAREIIRFIQEMRKEAGYEVDNRIKICYSEKSAVFEEFGTLIAKETLATELTTDDLKDFDLEKEIKIDGLQLNIKIRRLA